MGTLKNFLTDNLPELKATVEEKLDVELGEVCLRPLSEYIRKEGIKNIKQHYKGHLNPRSLFIARLIAASWIYFNEATTFYIAKCGESSIYYSRNPLLILRSNNEKTSDGLHELVHIAHMRLLEKINYKFNLDVACIKGDIPIYVAEGFADYVVDNIMEERNGDSRLKMKSFANLKYKIPFFNELISNGVYSFEDVKEHVLTYH